MKYRLLILLFFFVLLACIDTHKELFISEVNTETLKRMLTNQKCHNKAIFIFDPACPTCIFYLRNEYPVMQRKFLDSIDYVFISTDTIPLEKYKQFFQSIGIKKGHLLSLHKNDSDYLQTNEKIISRAIQYLFLNKEDIYIRGFPISAMVNKENKVKLEYYVMDDSNAIIRPQPWHRLYLSNLSEIDFNVIDSCNSRKIP